MMDGKAERRLGEVASDHQTCGTVTRNAVFPSWVFPSHTSHPISRCNCPNMSNAMTIPAHVMEYLKQGEDSNIPPIPDEPTSLHDQTDLMAPSPPVTESSVTIPTARTAGRRNKTDTGLSESWEWKEMDDEQGG